jgi:hypothetical protein
MRSPVVADGLATGRAGTGGRPGTVRAGAPDEGTTEFGVVGIALDGTWPRLGVAGVVAAWAGPPTVVGVDVDAAPSAVAGADPAGSG